MLSAYIITQIVFSLLCLVASANRRVGELPTQKPYTAKALAINVSIQVTLIAWGLLALDAR